MFEELIKYYLDCFHKDGEKAIKTICNCDVPSQIILEQYKKFEPLEKLPEKEKSELKQYVIEMFPGQSVEFLVKAAKVVYTIGSLL